MKKPARLITVAVLVMFLISGILAGCGGGQASNDQGTTKGAEDTTASAETTVAQQTLDYKELNFYYPSNVQKDQEEVNAKINEILKEKLNCSLIIKPIDWGQWGDKYPIMLASGEQVDLIFSASWSGYLTEVAKNSFLPLDELLEKYGQDIKKNMQAGYLDAAKVKGKLYSIPVNKDMGQGWGVIVNKEMADRIGADMSKVKYLEDLEPILALAKEKLPGVIPYVGFGSVDFAQIYAATKALHDIGFADHSKFDEFDNGNCIAYDIEKDTAVSYYEIPEYIDQCRLVRTWFQKGYINDDIVTTQMKANDVMKNGDAFMMTAAQSNTHLNGYESELGRSLYTVEFVPGVKQTASLTGAVTCIANACVDPERAMMIMNLVFSDNRIMDLFAFGIEGKHYERVSGNVIKLPEGVTQDNSGYWPANGWEFGNTLALSVLDNESPTKYEDMKVYNDSLTLSALLGFTFDGTNVKTELAAHMSVLQEYNKLLINGAADTDSTLKKMRDKDKAAGIDKIIAEMNKQVKEWKATK